MKIHTSLHEADLATAMNKTDLSDVTLHVIGRPGSRSHVRAFEVALRGHGRRHKRPPNTGIVGAASPERAATRDDWGNFMAQIFAVDPNAIFGPYKGSGHFHRETKGAYAL
jgi:hypothetical protein